MATNTVRAPVGEAAKFYRHRLAADLRGFAQSRLVAMRDASRETPDVPVVTDNGTAWIVSAIVVAKTDDEAVVLGSALMMRLLYVAPEGWRPGEPGCDPKVVDLVRRLAL